MKSSDIQLKNRGYACGKESKAFEELNECCLLSLLKSQVPFERTVAIRVLVKNLRTEYLPVFCEMLKNEKSLYTKIELCDAIVKYRTSAIPYLLPLLGKIGGNQHKTIKIVDLNKKSFPLPRDITARILVRIGTSVIPYMESILIEGQYIQKLEAIDVIGHICWNFKDFRSEPLLLHLLQSNPDDKLLKWKIVRAFQSYNSKKIIDLLKDTFVNESDEIIKAEAQRSLNRIGVATY